jgi:hypothetical protein
MKFRSLKAALALALAASSAACVVIEDTNSSGPDTAASQGSGSTDGGSDSAGSDATGQPTTTAGSDSGGGAAPKAGTWNYVETGVPTNSCTFLDPPSNGWGNFVLADNGGGSYTVTAADDSEPFPCTLAGSTMTCPERVDLEEDYSSMGLEALAQSLVSVDATVVSSTMMTGTQKGTVTCTGKDCGLAEIALGTTLPCSFEIKFDATAL